MPIPTLRASLLLALLAVASSLHADQADDWRAALTSRLQAVHEAQDALLGAGAALGVVVPGELEAAVAGHRAAAERLRARIAMGGVSELEFEGCGKHLDRLIAGLEGLNQLTRPLVDLDRNTDLREGPAVRGCVAAARRCVSEALGPLAAGEELESEFLAAMNERGQLFILLTEAANEPSRFTNRHQDCPPDSPALAELRAYCLELRQRLAGDAARPISGAADRNEDTARRSLESAAMFCLSDLTEVEVYLHQSAPALLAPRTPVDDELQRTGTAYVAALRAKLAAGRGAGTAGERVQRQSATDRDIGDLRGAWDSALQAKGVMDRIDQHRAATVKALARLDPSARPPFQARLDAISAEAGTTATALSASIAASDDVGQREATGQLRVAELQLGQVAEEADQEAEFAARARAWQGHEQDPRLADPIARLREAQARCARARSARDARALLELQVANRIELLNLKRGLMAGSTGAIEQAAHSAMEEARRRGEEVDEALRGPGKAERDAQEAGRIPLKGPGDNGF